MGEQESAARPGGTRPEVGDVYRNRGTLWRVVEVLPRGRVRLRALGTGVEVVRLERVLFGATRVK